MRSQVRLIVFGAVIAVIVVSWIVESPGAVEGVGLAVVLIAMVLLIAHERRDPR